MTTAQETPHVGDLLKRHRKDHSLSKASMYRALEITPGTYDHWEGGIYTPGDEYAERIAELLDLELREIVWLLYRERLNRAKGVYLGSLIPRAA